jgi:hypothetical protein
MPDYPDHIIKVERAPEKAEFNSTYDNAALVYDLAGRSGLYYNVHNTSTDHFAVVYMIVAGSLIQTIQALENIINWMWLGGFPQLEM